MPDLHPEFTAAMFNIYRRALQEEHYPANYFREMLEERFGYETAMQLIHDTHPSSGYTALWERKRLDLTVEALILRPQWYELFTDDDRLAAYQRLHEYEFQFPPDSWHPPA
jgi:hypothetical protein